jgi:hypothetical protein
MRFAEQSLSGDPGVVASLLGTWTHELGGWSGNWSIQLDPNAPQSAPSVGQTLFPNGHPSGNAPVQFDGWALGGYGATFYQQVYLSIWIKILGTNYENQVVGTKMGFIGYGQAPLASAGNQGFFILEGTGSQTPGSAFNLGFWQQNHVSRNLEQNVNLSKIMTVGVWHHWEALLEMNTLGSANGGFKWWVDGTLILNYTDVVYSTAGNPFGFYNYRWNPTWGGMGGTKTRDDFMQIDHIYLSGVQ